MSTFAEVHIELLSSEKGGRKTPISLAPDAPATYRPHFRVRGGNGEYLGVEFVDGPDEPIQPGGRTFATVRFIYDPDVCYDALVVGTDFDIMEGAQIVGSGRVTRR